MRRLLFAASVFALIAVTGAHAASFDCARARMPDEKAICANRSLNDADVKMTTMLEIDKHLVPMGHRGEIQDDQHDWLAARRLCKGNVKCLSAAYDKRIAALQSVLDMVASHGPF